MTSNLAYALPAQSPDEHPRRHIEIVTTRNQRRARPRLVYAVVTVLGLFSILMAQLMLSIVVSQGAYTISSLQLKQKALTRSEQALTDQLAVLSSPQNLAIRAQALGMVSNASPAFLRLSDGTVLGSPTAASAPVTAAGAAGAAASSGNLIPNSLISAPSTPPAGQAGTATPTVPSTSPGTPAASAAPQAAGTSAPSRPAGSIPSTTGALPAPVTR